jgi:alpha-1,6-mannosyltransferase
MVFCDIASFYTQRGGGVSTYHDQKLAYFANQPAHRYALVAPASEDAVERVPGGTIYWLRGFRFDANYRHLYRARALRRVLREVRPDVLDFGSPYLDYWVGSWAARNLGAVRAAYYHVDFPDTYVRPFLRRRIGAAAGPVVAQVYRYVKLVFGRLDATFVASRYIFDKLRALGLANLTYLPFGVDTKTFTPARRSEECRRRLGMADPGTLLLFAGRYRSDKGLDVLLSALPRILEDSAVHVAFAGSGPLETAVRRVATDHERVHDLGFTRDKAQLADVYASADGFLSPGEWETFGLGICEALASGVPVVSAAGGAGAEMVSRFGCGLLFRPGDAADLARAALAIAHSDVAAQVRAARETLQTEFTWNHVFDAYVDHLHALRGNRTAGAAVGA